MSTKDPTLCYLRECGKVIPDGTYFCSQEHKDRYWHDDTPKVTRRSWTPKDFQKATLELGRKAAGKLFV